MKFKPIFKSNWADNAEYQKSNDNTTVALSRFSRTYANDFLNKSDSTPSSRQQYAQSLTNYLCDKFKIPHCKVKVLATPQPRNGRVTIHGRYTPATCTITLYNITAKQLKTISIKTLFDTLLHEFIHHYDMTKLGMTTSPHTAGFKKRISDLKAKIS